MMLTTASPEFTNWKRDLVDLGFKEEHINDSLISQFTAHGIQPLNIVEDQIKGYFFGKTREPAECEAAKEYIGFDKYHEVIADFVDWPAAWQHIKDLDQLELVKASENDWVLMSK
jgi:hypothetical protein